jgi:hypothetical protein
LSPWLPPKDGLGVENYCVHVKEAKYAEKKVAMR